jgi:hypothetical protein
MLGPGHALTLQLQGTRDSIDTLPILQEPPSWPRSSALLMYSGTSN